MKTSVFTLLVALNPCYVLSAMSNEVSEIMKIEFITVGIRRLPAQIL